MSDDAKRLTGHKDAVSKRTVGFREIGPSDSFGARKKVVLRDKGNAWTPVSWSFDKLHEVRVLSYLKLHFVYVFCNA